MGIHIKRVGHVCIWVSDFERSFRFYTDVLGCTVTNRRTGEDGSGAAFLRFEDTHHDIVLFKAPEDEDNKVERKKTLNHIALQVDDRDEFLRALAHLRSKGVEITDGPLIHGIEGGGNAGGSGSRSFYFEDPDGNRLEIFTDMMSVPNGEEFPRKEYAQAVQSLVQR